MAFSMLEMKLVLATILSRYQLALADPRPVQPVRRGITLVPSGGVPVVVKHERTAKPFEPIKVRDYKLTSNSNN
jgi:cytochrome P450